VLRPCKVVEKFVAEPPAGQAHCKEALIGCILIAAGAYKSEQQSQEPPSWVLDVHIGDVGNSNGLQPFVPVSLSLVPLWLDWAPLVSRVLDAMFMGFDALGGALLHTMKCAQAPASTAQGCQELWHDMKSDGLSVASAA